MFFSGSYKHTLDNKGRVIVPAEHRDEFGDRLYLSPGQDRCVEVYPQEVFEERVEELRHRPREDAQARRYQRFFLARSQPQSMDAQGRVVVPQGLREYAGLNRQLMVIGNDQRLEIWDREAWREHEAQIAEDYASVDTPFQY